MEKCKENKKSTEKQYLPSDLARAANVSVRVIQKWTNKGSLPETRDKNGWRIYDVDALEKAMELGNRRIFRKRKQKET